jgi:hypothetical protein
VTYFAQDTFMPNRPDHLAAAAPGYAVGALFCPGGGIPGGTAREAPAVVELHPGGAVLLRVPRWSELENPHAYACPPGPDPGSVVGEAVVVFEDAPDAEGGGEEIPHGGVAGPGGEGEAGDAAHGHAGAEEAVGVTTTLHEVAPDPVALAWGRDRGIPAEGLLLEGLAPGTWNFVVRRGSEDCGGEIYGSAEGVVVAGRTTPVTVAVTPTSAGPRRTVTGRILVPEAWGFPAVAATLRGVDPRNADIEEVATAQPLPADGAPASFAWRDLPPGRYRLTVSPPGWAGEVVVPDAPDPSFDAALPRPGEVVVAAVDRATGEALLPSSVSVWGSASPGPLRAATAELPETLHRVLPGEIRGHVFGPEGYRDTSFEVKVAEGASARVVVRLRRAAVIVVLLRSAGEKYTGEASVEAQLQYDIEKDAEEFARLAADSDDGGVVTGMSTTTRDGGATLSGLTEGIQLVEVSGRFGRLTREVSLAQGQRVEVVFEIPAEPPPAPADAAK